MLKMTWIKLQIFDGTIMPNIVNGFIESAKKFPNRSAVIVNSIETSYRELSVISSQIAATIERNQRGDRSLVAFLSHKSLVTYASVLGILLSGNGYVPLNPKFPAERLKAMIKLSGVKIVIVDAQCLDRFKEILEAIDVPLIFIFPNIDKIEQTNNVSNLHQFIFSKDMAPAYELNNFDLSSESPAYLLFTSGSTGTPKGVLINQGNVEAYTQYMVQRGRFNEHDRFSQLADMTFDPSVHDMFVCWEVGASLYCVPELSSRVPSVFFRDNKITTCFMIPSIAMFMQKMKSLKPGSFPYLRYSVFCGEPLLSETALQWKLAAPNSVIENLYGPTEATVAITNYVWTEKSPEECVNGIVPIGYPFDGQKICIINDQMGIGELCLSGTQVTTSYFNNDEKTRTQYVKINGELWYRTGDLVKEDSRRCLYYLGRIDSQVKIMGYRVELQEINYVLQKAAGTEMVFSVTSLANSGGGCEIVAFICKGVDATEKDITAYCRQYLPEYMVPKKIVFINEMPLNNNGKIDGIKLKEMAKTL